MYASDKPLYIDRIQVISHLTALGYKDGNTIYLRFFFPDGDPRKDKDKGRKLEGKFPDLPWSLMEQMQAEGRGCYFVVNGNGHNDSSVTQCRAIFYEHDRLEKELQRDLWQKLGLPEPTVQVDSGGKSIHNFWKLVTPCTPEQWRELQEDLLEFADGDRKLKNPSRVMRLAGAYYFKPEREPVQSKLILNNSKSYSYEQLRAIVPRQQKQKQELEPTQIRWYEFEKNFQLPIDDQVPLYECLTRADRDLIDRGAGEGERNERGYALAANLVATTEYLGNIGQHYEGDPRQFFDQYCHRCTPPVDSAEAEAIWTSANQRAESTSLPPHLIANCVKGWKWRQIRGEKQQQSEQLGQATLISDRGSRKVVSHPTANRETLNTEELKHRIDTLIAEDLPQSELEAIIPDLAHLANRQPRDVWGQYRARLVEIDKSDEREEIRKALPSLLEVQQQRLDPHKYLWGDNGKLAKQLNETAIAMPTAVEFLLTTLVAVCGSVIGTAARIVIKTGSRYVQPAIYRTCVVAPSGFKKTPAQRLIIDPLDELNSEEYKLWLEANEEYKTAQQQYERDLKSKRKNDDVDDPPKEPAPRKQYIVTDTTFEALIKIHSENPRGLLLYRDEWSAHITGRNKYRNGSGDDAENELSEFNGGSLSKNRIKESLFLERTAISRTGSTQPETLKRHMGDHTDFSGEFARWLFCAAECPPGYIDLLSPDADVDIGISQNLRSLYIKLHQLPKGDYFLADDAKAIFQKYQHHLVDWTLEETQLGLKTSYPKFETYFVRLILWLHVVNGILTGETPQQLISGETVSKAASLTDYFIGQLRLIYAYSSPQDELKGRLLDIKKYIEGKPDGVTPRDIKAKNWKFRKIPTFEIAQDCRTLESSGYIYAKDGRYYPTGNGGNGDGKNRSLKPQKTGSGNSPNKEGVDVVDKSSTPPDNPENPNHQESGQSDCESVDVVDVLLMNPQHPQPYTDKGVEVFVDVVDENLPVNHTHDCDGTSSPHQQQSVDVSSTEPQQHQQNDVILSGTSVEGVDETSTKHQHPQHLSATEPTETFEIAPKVGDTVRIPNDQLGVVDMVYPDGQLGVFYDGGLKFAMWEPSQLMVVPPNDD